MTFDIAWVLEKPDVEIMSKIIGRITMLTVLPKPNRVGQISKKNIYKLLVSVWKMKDLACVKRIA